MNRREKLPATWEEWERAVLLSADRDGRVTARVTDPWIAGLQRLIGMELKGLLRRRDGWNGGPWMITDAGRSLLQSPGPKPDGVSDGE